MAVVKEAVEAVAEEVADNADVIAETARRWTARDGSLLTGGIVLGLAAGVAIGWAYTSKRLRDQYAKIAEDEIALMRVHYRKKEIARNEQESKTIVKRDVEEIAREAGYTPPVVTDRASPIRAEDRNVFAEQEKARKEHVDEWDYEQEVAARSQEIPYVIHYDERNERDYSSSTLTYYAGDDVLCDERDKVIDARDEIIGDHNLDSFGHGSNDPVIVYIRNDALSAEFEIVKSEKTYAEEVHGLSHSDYPRPRRTRFDDE